MSDALDLDFDPEELAMLRQLFRGEAHEALETVTTRVLAGGSARPSADALTEMMRVTHTLKGAAGTVGLTEMVDLSHRLESALEAIEPVRGSLGRALGGSARRDRRWAARVSRRSRRRSRPGANLSALADALRARIDVISRHRGPRARGAAVVRVDDRSRRSSRPGSPTIRRAAAATTPASLADSTTATASEPRTFLRVEPERIDALMSSAGELLFDRTRIERRVQLLRTLARDQPRAHAAEPARRASAMAASTPPTNQRGALSAAESELAGQAALLSADDRGGAARRRDRGAAPHDRRAAARGLTRIRMESARAI